ncbi:MAG TPA: restriction endonuclease subunit S [Methanocorpusculum sp.]|nr:restriction endonuclease subunit S [Methanocorpusculum sp.]
MRDTAEKGKGRWPQVRLGDVCDDKITSISSKENFDIIYIDISSIDNKTKCISSYTKIPAKKAPSRAKQILKLNDILVSTVRPNLNAVAINTLEEDTVVVGSTGYCVLRSTEKIENKYLFYFCQSPTFIGQLVKRAKGASYPAVSNADVKNIKIPLPPLPEQRRIAAVLDQVSSLIALRKAQLAKLDLLVKARFVEMCDSTGETTSLSYYIRSLVAGKSLVGKTTSINKVLKTGAVTYDYFDATQIKNLPSEYEPQPEHLVRVNDVIISRMNTSELVGAAGYVWRVPNNIYLPDRLWRVEPMDHTNPLFLWHLLIQQSTKNSIKKIASGTSGSMKNISKSGLLGIKVKKVDLETQNNFAKFAKQTNKSKVEIQQGLIQLETLKKSLMQEYFG